MKCQAAVLRGVGKDWEIEQITLDPPREAEVLVKMAAAGVCRSDDHFATGDAVPTPDLAAIMEASGTRLPEYFPVLGGHEGAGIVEEVGPGVRSVRPVIVSRSRSSRHVVPVGGVCRA
jgi:Zn-dependent alcohol dehydrogenase